jgi:hypothetical protein
MPETQRHLSETIEGFSKSDELEKKNLLDTIKMPRMLHQID